MKLEININKDEENERIVIFANEMTEELQHVVNEVEKMIQEIKLYGKKEDEIYPLNIKEIIRFYSQDKQIYAENQSGNYRVEKRLYELETILPKDFIRISQSEIINIRYIKKLRQELNGFIKISFKNGIETYSSRRYVKIIKEALQL
ncbi:MAG TPA: LytTR family DNA-binding domain-containing protein [Pseudogracilibacillus sp.]|nr:LytTR family DNA-binding domain-containing protein [Pseudogracilibacillus sp.]